MQLIQGMPMFSHPEVRCWTNYEDPWKNCEISAALALPLDKKGKEFIWRKLSWRRGCKSFPIWSQMRALRNYSEACECSWNVARNSLPSDGTSRTDDSWAAIRKESCLERKWLSRDQKLRAWGRQEAHIAGGGERGGLGVSQKGAARQVGSQVKRFEVGCSQPGALQETYRRASEEKDAAIM